MMRSFMILMALATAAHAASFDEGMALKRDGKAAEAEKVFAQVVAENPRDAAALVQWATVLGWLNRYDESIAASKRALAENPDDPDAALGLARVQYWKGELAPARAGMDTLLARSPDNVDALTLAGDIAVAAGDLPAARGHYQKANTLAPSADLSAKLSRTHDGPTPWRVDAGGQVDGYDTRSTEGSFFGQLSFQAAKPLTLTAGYEQLHQFGQTDHRLNAGAYVSPAAGILLDAKLAVSPTADTVASWDASGGGEFRLAKPFFGILRARHMSFSELEVTILGAGGRLELGRFSLSGQGGAVLDSDDNVRAFGTGRVEYAASEAWHLYAGFARGEQTQKLLPAAVATDVTAGVTWQVDARWGLRLDYLYEKYGDTYVRNSVGSALTFKF